MNQKGISQILILIIILVGFGVGFYLVNYTKTNLKPKASATTHDMVIESLLSKAEPAFDSIGDRRLMRSSDTGIAGNPKYDIQYFPEQNLYTIYIYATPVETVREEAENAFLQKMQEAGGNMQDMCLLKARVIVPDFVSADGQPGEDDRLGLCK